MVEGADGLGGLDVEEVELLVDEGGDVGDGACNVIPGVLV